MAAVGGDHDVEVEVAVDVGKRGAPAHLRLRERAADGRDDVGELPAAAVVKQVRRLGIGDAAVGARERVVDVAVDDEQILQAVEIDVEEEAAEAQRLPRGAADVRPRRRVLELPVADRPVEPQHLAREVGDDHRGRAGVVHVGGVDAHAGAGAAFLAERQAGLEAQLDERAVAVVAIELVGLRVVGDEDVGPGVGVVLDQRHAQRLRRRVEQSRLRGDVVERAVAAIAEEPRRRAAIRFGRAVRLLLAVHAALRRRCPGVQRT